MWFELTFLPQASAPPVGLHSSSCLLLIREPLVGINTATTMCRADGKLRVQGSSLGIPGLSPWYHVMAQRQRSHRLCEAMKCLMLCHEKTMEVGFTLQSRHTNFRNHESISAGFLKQESAKCIESQCQYYIPPFEISTVNPFSHVWLFGRDDGTPRYSGSIVVSSPHHPGW